MIWYEWDACLIVVVVAAMHELIENMGKSSGGTKDLEILEEGSKFPTSGSPLSCQKKMNMEEGEVAKKQQMPPASVMTRLILIMVWRKLIRNPNTYSSLFGLTWSLISFRFDHFILFNNHCKASKFWFYIHLSICCLQVEHSDANNCKWVDSNIIRCWSGNGNV